MQRQTWVFWHQVYTYPRRVELTIYKGFVFAQPRVFNPGPMSLENKKLGLLLSASPEQPNFDRAVALAAAALKNGVQVYFYCIDDAVAGFARPQLQALKQNGVKLFACAYGAQRRQISPGDLATFAGLGTVSDLIANTDRFVSFN